MATFILLSTLTDDGAKTIQKNPGRICEVNQELESMGVRVLSQWATMGPYDFVNVVGKRRIPDHGARFCHSDFAWNDSCDDHAGNSDRRFHRITVTRDEECPLRIWHSVISTPILFDGERAANLASQTSLIGARLACIPLASLYAGALQFAVGLFIANWLTDLRGDVTAGFLRINAITALFGGLVALMVGGSVVGPERTLVQAFSLVSVIVFIQTWLRRGHARRISGRAYSRQSESPGSSLAQSIAPAPCLALTGHP